MLGGDSLWGADRKVSPSKAQKAVQELERLAGRTEDAWWQGRVAVERDVVTAWISQKQGDADEAVRLLTRAAENELAAGKQSVEPGHTISAAEQLGELLLELGRPAEALVIFKRSLADSPRRFHSLFGAGRAAEMSGMNTRAAEFYETLAEMVGGTSHRPQLKHAATFLAEVAK